MNSPPNILFFGTPLFGKLMLEKLVTVGYAVKGVVTRPDRPRQTPVKQYAVVHAIPVFEDLLALSRAAPALEPTVGIIGAYGRLIPGNLIKKFPYGILNIHFSALPKYRGAAPVPWAILSGDTHTKVTIFRITDTLDAGPIIAQHGERIHPFDTASSLHARLSELGSELLLHILPDYLAGRITPHAQDEAHASWAPRLTRKDGYIDLSSPPADLERRIRAFYPWPTVWTMVTIKGKRRRLLLLPDTFAQLEGKQPVSFTQLLEGYPELAMQLAHLPRYR